MHTRHVLAALALAVLAPACLAPVESSPGDTPIDNTAQAFDASVFKFMVWVKDDGKDSGGGWQRAVAPLSFVDTRGSFFGKSWVCIVSVQLPIRSSYVAISPEAAAEMTANVANVAGSTVMHSQPSWPITGLFCCRFAEKMQAIFSTTPGAPNGAKVTSQ